MALEITPELDPDSLPQEWRWLSDMTLAGNEVWRVLGMCGSLLLVLIAGRVLRHFLRAASARLEARSQKLGAVGFAALAQATGFVSLAVGIAVGVQFLRLSNDSVQAAVQTVVSILLTTAVGYTAYCLVEVVSQWLRGIAGKNSSRLDDMLTPMVTTSLRGTIVVLVLVQIATILSDKPATSIIAGLGVGGLAVGLAAQDTIKNFFGSMMIFGDRPFELGDEITVDSIGGSVEMVGFRSTRFRTGEGHLVTIPNGELANKTIVNVSRRSSLLRKTNLALSYDLPPEKIEAALAIVREILTDHEGLRPEKLPRVFINDLTPTAINLLMQYWYHPADWWQFVAFNERVNLKIIRRFAEAEITFAVPAQKLEVTTGLAENDQPRLLPGKPAT